MRSARSIQRADERHAAYDKKLPIGSFSDALFLERLVKARNRREQSAALAETQAARPLKPPGRK